MYTTAPLFGRFHSPLQDLVRPLRRQPLHHLESLCSQRLAPDLLEPNPAGDNSRERVFTPKLTFLAFLDQILNPDSSCRNALNQIKSYYQSQAQYPAIADNTSGYCQARRRWDTDQLIAIRRQLAGGVSLHADTLFPGVPGQRPLKVVDGSSFHLPDTLANRSVCPQSEAQAPGCGFPLVRVVGVFCLKTGMLLEEATASYIISENALFQDLWPTFQAGDVLVMDRNFGAYGSFASLGLKGVDLVSHLHASRSADFRKGVRLGRHDRLITWSKSRNRPANLTREEWAALPATCRIRLVRIRLPASNGRCQSITLATTLLDPQLWPVKLLAALYARRWKIELYWDDIKTTLSMDYLSCLTPEMVHKEIQMHFIAYNLLRALMVEAALTTDVPLDRLSFKGTLDAARQYSLALGKMPISHRRRRRTLYAEMLATIAGAPVPDRPNRREPRCQKRRPKPYPFMTRPRREMQDPPKRCRHTKTTSSLT